MTHQSKTHSQTEEQEQKPAQDARKPDFGMSREDALKRNWQAAHRDLKGKRTDGALSLMSFEKFGRRLVTADSISDEELAERLQEVRIKNGR